MKKIAKVTAVKSVSSKDIKGITMGSGAIHPRKSMSKE